jgi:hypothetical protein
MIFLTSGRFPVYLSLCKWASLNLWISNRNLLRCQWGHKEGNWPSKRVHCETTWFGEGSVCGDGHNSCRGLYGEFPLLICSIFCFLSYVFKLCISVDISSKIWLDFFDVSNRIFISNFRGDSVPILVWTIKLLKLLRKLWRKQKNLI